MFTKDFFKDRLILLLGALTLFLTALTVVLILWQADFSQPNITYRHLIINGNSRFDATEPTYLYFFIFMALIVLLTTSLISYKIYDYFRPGAYTAFVLGQIVLVANIFVVETIMAV